MKQKLIYCGVFIVLFLSMFCICLIYNSNSSVHSFTDKFDNKQYYYENIKHANSLKYIDKNHLNEIKVAIIDSPIDMQCTDLPVDRIDQKYIFPEKASKAINTEHATQICSIITGNQNDKEGICGLANGVKIFSYIVTDGISTIQISDIVKAIDFAINDRVDVINLSFGSYDYSIEEEKVIKKALDNGIVVVASFGSKGDPRGLYPAILDGVISVGAVDKDNDLLITSNYGENLCVVAPGNNIIGAVGNDCFKTSSGSSFATPIVTALVALIKAKNNSLSPDQIKNIIEANCTDIGPPGRDMFFGAGLIDFEKTLKNIN